MKTITCDVCRRAIEKPVKTRNYFHLADVDICEPCNDILQLSIKRTMRTKTPFNYEWYDQLLLDTLKKGIEKGKIEIK
jgi:hypothetical protein